MQGRVRIAFCCALALAALSAAGQQRRVHEYKLHEQADRGTPFAITVGPDQTLYTLLTRRDGNWVLSRLEGWWLDHPQEQGILIEGFSARDPVEPPGQITLAVTPDNKFLVTILSGTLRTTDDSAYPMDMIVEVVRLGDFQVVETEHLRALGMRGNLLGALDRSGHILVSSSLPSSDESGASGPYVTWFRLMPPVLKAELLCSYQTPADAKNPQAIEDVCGPSARSEGYSSAADITALFPQKTPPPAALPPGISLSAKDSSAAATVTVDGKPLTLVVINGTEVDVYAPQ